jgi:hypothetical protein
MICRPIIKGLMRAFSSQRTSCEGIMLYKIGKHGSDFLNFISQFVVILDMLSPHEKLDHGRTKCQHGRLKNPGHAVVGLFNGREALGYVLYSKLA